MTHRTFHQHSCGTAFLAKALQQVTRFLAGENAVTAIEYALIASLIAIAALGGIAALGVHVGATWTHVATEVGNAT
ncbi:Flp family type IVb pilin [Uliginosibacterium sp. 31-16]|uniref:Flp family type IVb pilin n=1 Tax=Uliginosibacterium sp. 31-16 TaxID=3068315 RepID=UPI00273F9F9D|nr:Flp family type IVb pilin [Uliginosibacterium sp. 31-16]MDP5238044.1 Flp family type IVb pilin [Uliginosibacterium sp. 31-16]